VDDAPGADDNGSGVVGVLEALRVLAPYNFARTITFIGFDFEEVVGLSGIFGSLKYVQSEIPEWETIDGVVNFEMIGYYDSAPNSQTVPTGFNQLYPDVYAELQADSFRGNFIVNAGDAESEAFTYAFDSLAGVYVPDLSVMSLILQLNGIIAPDFRRSDHANFWDIDVPALLITDGANMRNPYYHTPADSLGTLNFTFMSNVVKAAVATIAELAGIQNSDFIDADILPSSIARSNSICPLAVLPNPSKAKFELDPGNCFGVVTEVKCFSAEGNVVVPKNLQKNGKTVWLDLSDQAQGIYFVQLIGKEKQITQRLILQH